VERKEQTSSIFLGATKKYSPELLKGASVEQGPPGLASWIIDASRSKIGGPYQKVSWAREALKAARGEVTK